MTGELYHHGILGMKWGKKNGPPYPLDVGDHSSSEKKAGWRKSLDKGGSSDPKKPKIDKQKVMKAATTAVAVAGMAYGGYKLYSSLKSGDLDAVVDVGMKAVDAFSDTSFSTVANATVSTSPTTAAVVKSTVPKLTLDRTVSAGEDYTAKILANYGDLSAAVSSQSTMPSSFDDLDKITMAMLGVSG